MRLRGMFSIITGGARTIGRATARRSTVTGFAKSRANGIGPQSMICMAAGPGFINAPMRLARFRTHDVQMKDRLPTRELRRPPEIADVHAGHGLDEADCGNGAVLAAATGRTP